MQNIEYELNQNMDKHSKTLIVYTLELLLNYCNRYYDRQFFMRTETNKDIISEFETLQGQYFKSEKLQEQGFEYSQYFSKMFKKNTGMTPAEYRNLN